MNSKVLALSIIILFSAVSVVSAEENTLTASQIMKNYDARLIPKDMKAEMVMNLVDDQGRTRSREVRTYRIGDDKQIMWFLQPAEVKGSSFLRLSSEDREDDMWIYLPAFEKVRRIASHAKNGNFMGSDFTYEDMGDWKLDDYTFLLRGEDKFDNVDCWVIESAPKEKVVTDYGKSVFWIWKSEYYLAKKELYDKKGTLRKIMTVTAKKLGSYWVMEKIVMSDLKRGGRTELLFKNIELDTGISPDLFKSSELTKIH